MDPRTALLLAAERGRYAVDRIDPDGQLGEDEAYRLQFEGVADRVARGDTVIGLKAGLTSRAKQKTMGVDQPILGQMLGSGLHQSGAQVDLSDLFQPRAEPEIAFRIGRDIEAAVDGRAVRAHVAGVMAGLEIIDSRYKNYKFGHGDVIADNTSAAKSVFGPETPVGEVGDLRLIGMVMSLNDEVVATAAGAAILGDPWDSLAWLATRAVQLGIPLRAGQRVLAGALTDASPIRPGDRVRLEFDGLPTLEASFC